MRSCFLRSPTCRGLRESGTLFAIPTYAFVGSFLCMIVSVALLSSSGSISMIAETDAPLHAKGFVSQPVSVFLLLSAFANGCTALTGVEAISNGVPAFKKPECRNAAITLLWMVGLLTTMFSAQSFGVALSHRAS